MQYIMKPQDIVILLKIISLDSEDWQQKPLAESLNMSQSEISQSLSRSKYSGLINSESKKVSRMKLMEFLEYGIEIVFPQKPGAISRGIPTAHSAPPLNSLIKSDEIYVWPSAKGKSRGQSIEPLYPSILKTIEKDDKLYALLALVDAIRVGRSRERELAIKELKARILNGK